MGVVQPRQRNALERTGGHCERQRGSGRRAGGRRMVELVARSGSRRCEEMRLCSASNSGHLAEVAASPRLGADRLVLRISSQAEAGEGAGGPEWCRETLGAGCSAGCRRSDGRRGCWPAAVASRLSRGRATGAEGGVQPESVSFTSTSTAPSGPCRMHARRTASTDPCGHSCHAGPMRRPSTNCCKRPAAGVGARRARPADWLPGGPPAAKDS